MEDIKKELCAALGLILECSDSYRERLASESGSGQKPLIAAHYSASAEFLRGCAAIDGLTLECSERLCAADTDNEYENVSAYAELFDILIDYRKALEAFMSDCELAITEKDARLGARLIKNSDILARKTAFLKNTL